MAEEFDQTEHEERRKKHQQICDLTAELTSTASDIGDWKIAKLQEYALLGLEAPYDIKELHTKRQAVRDEINRLQEELEEE